MEVLLQIFCSRAKKIRAKKVNKFAPSKTYGMPVWKFGLLVLNDVDASAGTPFRRHAGGKALGHRLRGNRENQKKISPRSRKKITKDHRNCTSVTGSWDIFYR